MDSELSRVAIAGRHVAARRETARARAFAVLRIAFGIVVAIDAAYKWVPAFRTETLASQFAQHLVTIDTPVEHQWIALWSWLAIHYQNPFGFAVAVIETAIAVGLLTGGFTRLVCVAGALFWARDRTAAEGMGLPITAGQTDIGTSIIYVFVFAALLFGASGTTWSVDEWLRGRTRFLRCLRD